MKRAPHRAIAALCLAVALLAGGASAAGVFLRGSGATAPHQSARGETVPYATDGIYRHNPARLVAEGVGWDIFTLFAAVPALLCALPALARGSRRARLYCAGMLGYFFYQYLMYALMWAFGPLFVPFILLYSASLGGLCWIVATLPPAELRPHVGERFPRRGIIALCLALAGVLLAMWSARIAAGLSGDLEGAMLLGQPTLVVQALDLGLIVPLAVFCAVALWRRWAVGYLLAAVLVVKAVAMAGAICLMVVLAGLDAGAMEWPPLVIFAGFTAASLALGLRAFRSVEPG